MEINLTERVKYLEKEFIFYYQEVRKASSYLFDISNGAIDDFDPTERNFSEYWTHEYLYRMYNILCIYFETLRLTEYLNEFKTEYEPIINDKKRTIAISSVILEYGDSADDLYLLIQWKKLLAPFEFFCSKKKEQNKRVIDFLECTNEILKITNTIVTREDDINSKIREVANFFFNGVKAYSVGYFVHKFNSYKPDIIIQELGVAIEYKLIRKDNEIGIKLDELIIDAKRYSGNHDNKECIAVFCLSTNVKKTRKEIREEWKNMNFPTNWTLIIIPDVNITTH